MRLPRAAFRPIPDGEWRDVLATQDPDEQNFLIARDAEPVAWLRVNGLCGGDGAWISMLVVSPEERRRGAGRYAVRFAEDFLRARGKRWAAIHTTADNAAARALYTACGYSLTDGRPAVMDDGEATELLTFRKEF